MTHLPVNECKSNMVEKRGSPSSCTGQRYRGQRPSGLMTSSSSLLTNGGGGGVVSPKGKHRRVDFQDEERVNAVAAAFPAMQFVNSTRRSSSSRASPSKERSPKRVMLSTSPASSSAVAAAAALGAFFAGPKFSEPPSPASLPKPPMHWTTQTCAAAAAAAEGDPCRRFSNHLKMLLNVSA